MKGEFIPNFICPLRSKYSEEPRAKTHYRQVDTSRVNNNNRNKKYTLITHTTTIATTKPSRKQHHGHTLKELSKFEVIFNKGCSVRTCANMRRQMRIQSIFKHIRITLLTLQYHFDETFALALLLTNNGKCQVGRQWSWFVGKTAAFVTTGHGFKSSQQQFSRAIFCIKKEKGPHW